MSSSSSATEAALLGLCLRSPENVSRTLTAGVTLAHFSEARHVEVFAAMTELERRELAPDLVGVGSKLPQHAAYLVDLCEGAPMAQSVEALAKEVRRGAWQREAVKRLGELSEQIGRRQAFESTSELRARVLTVLDRLAAEAGGGEKGPRAISAVIDAYQPELERRVKERKDGKPPGITTGIKALDLVTGGGLGQGWITTVAARTGKGKTTLAINLLHAAASAGYGCAYFTVEMLSQEILVKLLSHAAQVNGTKLRIGDLAEADFDRLYAAQRELYERPIWFDDSTEANFEAVEHACMKLRRQGRLDLIVVDYIQQFRVAGRFGNTNERITAVSHRLKQLANKLKLSVISVAQLNREAEKGESAPDVFHIKDAGAIEQDSDLILLIHSDGPEDTRLFIGKNRHGKERIAFPIGSDLARSTFKNLNINLEAFK